MSVPTESVPTEWNKKLLAYADCCNREKVQKWITEPKCEIGVSKKHGLGVFATKDMNKFEIITLYPSDGVKTHSRDRASAIYNKKLMV